MTLRIIRAVQVLVAALATFIATTPAIAQYWQCAPYARQISGVEIYGNAYTWWAQAEGKYQRGHAPKVGAVLAIKSSGKMRLGHVAMVSQIVSDREILLTHANWSRGGQIERNVRAIDVSDAGDWSKVKIWYGPNGDLGTSNYPAYGFIYADKQPTNTPQLRIASNNLDGVSSFIENLRSHNGD